MKGLSLVLLALSFSAFAVTSPDLKGQFNLDEITTDYAKNIGIQGILPVSINAEVTEGVLRFKGFRKDTYCIEYNEDGIPHHPETRSCAKEETSWTPEVVMDVKNIVLNVNIAELKLLEKLPKSIPVGDDCIENMESVKIISDEEPTEIGRIFFRADCKAAVYTRFERLNVKPKALKGHNMEAIFDLRIAVGFDQLVPVEVNSYGPVKLNLTEVRVETLRSGLASLGKFNTKLFKYYGTVKFDN